MFIEALNNDVDELLKHKHVLLRNNISQYENNITIEFSQREDLVFHQIRQRRSYINTRCRRLYIKS